MTWTILVSKARSFEHADFDRYLRSGLREVGPSDARPTESPGSTPRTDGPPKKRRRKREENEQAVAQYLAEHAFQKPSVSQVAIETGVPRSSVGKTVPWKLYTEMLGHNTTETIATRMSEFADPGEFVKRLTEEQRADAESSTRPRKKATRDG